MALRAASRAESLCRTVMYIVANSSQVRVNLGSALTTRLNAATAAEGWVETAAVFRASTSSRFASAESLARSAKMREMTVDALNGAALGVTAAPEDVAYTYRLTSFSRFLTKLR